ncbi:Uncharacterised protein [Actinomyces bovis]|uniref:Uncharacterized protein n=1 Tax=Actinomyces bovis TaxID=1658 RepID=A0ABY1VM02_9ACTO|nr:hypothetical protein [Actinomyces bovis]SPT52777.1 Uncharacterised protein [Actinomyces bovis]VEG54797.1 Uncharacterised protein [Actinomyces israelii]
MQTNAAKLTSGLGGQESVWRSPLADQLATGLQAAVKSVDGGFESEGVWLDGLIDKEPEKVEPTDPRAKSRG